MFILFLPYLNTLCFSGNWNSVFGPRNRWIWSCRSNTTSQLQLFANTNIFCLNFLQFRFFTWKRRKEILRSLSQVRPKEFTYFLKITFGIVTVHPLPITPLRSLRRNYVLIKQMTVMHIKQITKFCSNKHDINSSFFPCQLAAVDVTKRVERTNARERDTYKKSWTNWSGIETGVILLISRIVLQICYWKSSLKKIIFIQIGVELHDSFIFKPLGFI